MLAKMYDLNVTFTISRLQELMRFYHQALRHHKPCVSGLIDIQLLLMEISDFFHWSY